MELKFLTNIKSGLIKNEIRKSLSNLDTSLIIPALDNILLSICLVEKDQEEVKREIANKLAQLIQALK